MNHQAILKAIGRARAEPSTPWGVKVFLGLLATATVTTVAVAGAGAYGVKKISEEETNNEMLKDLKLRVEDIDRRVGRLEAADQHDFIKKGG